MLLMQMNLFGSMMSMKKYTLIAAMAAMAILAGSCAKEQDRQSDKTFATDQNLVKMHFTARTEGSPTKTTLNTSTGAVSWAAGDAIKMVWELDGVEGSSVSDELSAGNISAGKAEFTAEVPDKFNMTEKAYTTAGGTSLHLYAVYPSSIETDYSTASSFYLTVPNVQDGSFEHASIALAKWDKIHPTSPIEFKNLCGLLQIVIANNDVKKIIVHSSDYIAGKANISFSGPKVISGAENDLKKDITINVPGSGTYYVAVLPTDASLGIGVNNLYVSLYDSSGTIIGEKTTTNPLAITRRQIRKLGTIATDAIVRLFVKKVAAGNKSGSSWDNAADYSTMQSKMNENGTLKVYMSAETYDVSTTTTIASSQAASNYEIIGGFPSDAVGCDLSGRVIGGTVLDGLGSLQGFNISAGSYTFDGITFSNFSRTDGSGGVMIIGGATILTCKNCIFNGNQASLNGGAIHFNAATGASSFTNCSFSNNAATGTSNNQGLGSAIGSAGSAGNPTININNCLFSGNHSYNGGAIWTRRVNYRLRDCSFVDNYADNGSATNGVGGAIMVDGSNTLSVYLDRVCFSYTTKDKVGKLATVRVKNANASLGLNNCTFSGSWGGSGIMQVSAYGNTVIANSTMFGRIGTGGTPTLYGSVHNQGTMVVANCIIPNAASNGAGRSLTTYGTSLALYNTLYSVMTGTADTYTATASLSGIKIFSSTENTNFPVYGGTTWYTGSDYSDKASSETVSDCRETVRYYEWNGSIPAEIDGAGSYSNISLTSLKTIVNTANSEFATWLGDDNLSVDIRGVARDTDAMWPGSYQGAGTKASIESLTIR